MNTDVLRIVYELQTFTCQELAEALEMTSQGAAKHLDEMLGKHLIHRLRIGYTYLYAPTVKLALLVSKLPAIDPDERCLPLAFPTMPDIEDTPF